MKNLVLTLVLTLVALANINAQTPYGNSVTPRRGTGKNTADLTAIVEKFKKDLGGQNNGTDASGTLTTSRREINWDGAPDKVSDPQDFPVDFFNVNSKRGAVFSTPEGDDLKGFRMSADSENPTNTPVRFGSLNPSYAKEFTTFSAERLFSYLDHNNFVIEFFISGTETPAVVSGFGAVLCDVDLAKKSTIEYFDIDGNSLGKFDYLTLDKGLSFVGVSFGKPIVHKAIVTTGNTPLEDDGSSPNDGGSIDVVAVDDLIYGEPQLPAPPTPTHDRTKGAPKAKGYR